MITERTLRQWRKDALKFKQDMRTVLEATPAIELCERILRLTQELLDQHLMRK